MSICILTFAYKKHITSHVRISNSNPFSIIVQKPRPRGIRERPTPYNDAQRTPLWGPSAPWRMHMYTGPSDKSDKK